MSERAWASGCREAFRRASVHAQPIHAQGNPRPSPGRERASCRSAVRRLGRTSRFWPVGSSRGAKILASRSVGRVGASLGERGAWPSLWSRASRRPRQPPSLPGRPSPGRTLAPPLYTPSILPFGTTGDQRCCERCQNSGRAQHGRRTGGALAERGRRSGAPRARAWTLAPGAVWALDTGAARAEHWRSAGAARAHHGRGPGRWRRAPSGRWTRARHGRSPARARCAPRRRVGAPARARAECAGQASGAARPSDARRSMPSPSTPKATPVHRPGASARHAARRSAGSAEQPVFGLSARAAGPKS